MIPGKETPGRHFQVEQSGKLVINSNNLIVLALSDIGARPANTARVPVNLSAGYFGGVGDHGNVGSP